jgi:nucleoside-diphosphate-sugar epimerase
MKHITLASRLKHQERILTQAAAGTVVLLDLDGGNYYALDGTGGRAWELGNGQRTVSEIAETIGDEYDSSRENIEQDLIELFTELANENLVEAIA